MSTTGKPRVSAVQLGGLGDLVLFSELIGSLKRSDPEWIVTLVCRSEFAAIAALFPFPPDEVIGWDLNPYLNDSPSEELRISLESCVERIKGLEVKILIDGSLRPTWLTWFLTSLLEPELSVCCGGVKEPEAMLTILRDWFGLSRRCVTDLGPPPGVHERDRYGLLLDYLGVPRVAGFPWRVPLIWENEAREWLTTNDVPLDRYLVCFPGGTAATALKRWPAANFIQVIEFAQSEGLRVVLLGDRREQELLTGIAKEIVTGGQPPVFCGDSSRLPVAAALLSMAVAYLGNDTGPMHLAEAYGVPGVAIFGGGGQWPRYAPWAVGSKGMVHPLPCFGCDWDCFLGRGLCVESIPVDAVSRALLSALKSREEPEIVSLQMLDSAILPLLADASGHYRLAQQDRARRMEIILELKRANEQSKASESQACAIRAKLEQTARRQLATVESMNAEASVHRAALKRLTAELADRERRAADLLRIAEDRMAVINAIAAEAEARQSMLEELTEAVREREARIGELERALAALARDEVARE